MPTWSRVMVSLGSAGLLWASFFAGWGWVVWLALIPFLWALDGVGAGWGVFLGAVFGVAFFALEFSSLLALEPFVGSMTVWICVALALYGALFLTAFGFAAGRWSHPFVWAGGWVLIEALRAAGPLGFTFGSVPGAMVGSPFLPAAAVGGPWLLSLGVAWTASCVVRSMRRPRWLAPAALAPLLLWGLSLIPNGTRETEVLAVALVQPNIPKIEQLDHGRLPDHAEIYRELLERIASPVDLVVAPENALPWLRDEPQYLGLFQDAARRLGAPLLVGTGDFAEGQVYNTILVLSPAGEVTGSYAKTRLVPFGEHVPWRGFWTRIGLGPLIDPFLPFDQTAGTEVRPVGNLGIMICFESTFPGISRDLVRAGAEVLISPTNDAWFGRTRILWEHYAMGALRAAETGRSFVQVGQTGISGAWGWSGSELGRLPPWTEGTAIVHVPLRTGRTLYVHLGDGPALGVAGALWVLGLAARRPRSGRGRGGRLREEGN